MSHSEKIELTARAVAPVSAEDGVSSLVRIARLVRLWLHGTTAAASPGRTDPSLRKLALHPLLKSAKLSYATLRRAMLVLRLIERHPEVSALKLSDTHLCIVAGLPDGIALALLNRVREQGWSTDKLAAEARPYRRGGGRRPIPALLRALSQISRIVNSAPGGAFASALAPSERGHCQLPAGSARYWAREVDDLAQKLAVTERLLAERAAELALLLIDPSPSRAGAVARSLLSRACAVRTCRTAKQALALRKLVFDSVILVNSTSSNHVESELRELGEQLVAHALAPSFVVVNCNQATAPDMLAARALAELGFTLAVVAAE